MGRGHATAACCRGSYSCHSRRPPLQSRALGVVASPVTRMLEMEKRKLHQEQVSIFLGHNTVLTFQETPGGDVWDPIRKRIETKGSRLRSNDASFLVYSLLDAIVDRCFPVLEVFSDRAEELEKLIRAH